MLDAVAEAEPAVSRTGAGETLAGLGARARSLIHEWWLPVVLLLLYMEAPLIALNRFELPLGISFGFRSFARNIALLMVIGIVVGARGMPRVRSSLVRPLLLFFAAAAVSVVANGWRWGDAQSLAVMALLFIGARSIGASTNGRRWLFHWIGALVVTTVLVEIVENPAILQFRESLRNTMVTAHPNTVGAFFALMAPVLLGAIDDDRARRAAPVYAFCAFLGAILTFSRLSLAGLFLGSAMIFLATWLHRRPRRLTAIGAVAIFVAAGTIGYLSLGRSEADWQRLRIIHASLTLFAENWLTGVGFGTEYLERVFPDRYAALYGTRVWLYHSHNMYVDILTETGVLGALAAGWFLVRLASLGRRALVASGADPRLRRVGSGFAATVAVFFLIGIGDMPWYDERLVFPLAIVWGLMEGWTCSVEEGGRPRPLRA